MRSNIHSNDATREVRRKREGLGGASDYRRAMDVVWPAFAAIIVLGAVLYVVGRIVRRR